MSTKQFVLDDTGNETMDDDCIGTAFTQHHDSRISSVDTAGDLTQAYAGHSAPRSGDQRFCAASPVHSQGPEPSLLDSSISNMWAAAENRISAGTPLLTGHTSCDTGHSPAIGLSPASVALDCKRRVQQKRKRAQASLEEEPEACRQNAEPKFPRVSAPAQRQQGWSAPSVDRNSPRPPLQTHASRLQLRQIPLEQALSRRRTFSPLNSVAPKSNHARPFWAALQPASNAQASRENRVLSDSQRIARCEVSQTRGPEKSITEAVTLNNGERTTGIQSAPAKEVKAHASTEQGQDRVNRLQVKAKAMKLFLEGLGKDMQIIQQDLVARQRTTDQAEPKFAERTGVQNALLEKAATIKSEALQIARDATNNLAALETRNKSLEEQLHNQFNILSTEKNIRLELQAQLSSTTKHGLLPEMKAHSNHILDKLNQIHAEMDDRGKDSSAESLERLLTATNDLNSQQVATAESVASIKSVLDSFSSSLVAQAGTHDSNSRIESSLKMHFNEALDHLKAEVSQRDNLSKQVIVHRETITHLKQQLRATTDEATEWASNLETRTRELAALQGQHVAVQAHFAAQSKSCEDKHSEKLARAELELQEKARALQTTSSDLAAISDENRSLRAIVESLQNKLSGWTAHVCPELNQQQFEEGRAAAVERVRKETTKAANDLHAQTKMECENKLKQVTTRVAQLEAELVCGRSEAAKPHVHEIELRRLEELARNREADIQSLHARTNELVTAKNHLEHTNVALNAQHETQKQHLQDALEAEQRLGQELDSTKEQLEKSKQQIHAAEHKLEQGRTDARRKLEDREAACHRQVESLQHRIEEMESDMLKHAEGRRKHEQEQERSRVDHLQGHEKEVIRLTNLMAESDLEKTRALAECRRLTDELLAMKSMPSSAQDVQGKPDSTSSTIIVPNSQHSSTAAGGNLLRTAAIDRGQDALAAIPFEPPDQVSRQTVEGPNAFAAVVEESQLGMFGFVIQDAAVSQGSLGPAVEESQPWDTLDSHHNEVPSPLATTQDYGLDANNGEHTEHQLDERFTFPSTARRSQTIQKTLVNTSQAVSQQNAIHGNRLVGNAAVANSQQDLVHDRADTFSRMPRPNSSAKRLKLDSVPQRGLKGAQTKSSQDRFLSQYVTPEPRGQGLGTARPALAIGQSSSPELITNVPVDMNLYVEPSYGNQGEDIDARVRGATSQIKHKADSELTLGDRPQRKPHSRQSTRTVAGVRTQKTRDTKNMTKDQRMSARFAHELQRAASNFLRSP